MRLVVDDPLAHRALDGLLRAEAAVRRRLAADLEREGLSAAGFSVLVVLVTAGGELELRTLRRRLGTSKANATEVVDTLERRSLVAATGSSTTAARSRSRSPRGRAARRAAVPRARRARGGHVPPARRRREAHARRALPQADGPAPRSARARTGPTLART